MWLPSVTIQNYYNMIDYIPGAALFHPFNLLLYNWKLVLLYAFPLLFPSPTPSPMATPSVVSVFMIVESLCCTPEADEMECHLYSSSRSSEQAELRCLWLTGVDRS